MKIQYAAFTIPIAGMLTEQEDMNKFLRSHRILQTWKEMVVTTQGPVWAILVEYMESDKTENAGQSKIDYKEVLSEADFAVFSKLREARKSLAETHGLPVYAVLTNEQLANIARRRPSAMTALMEIDGIGQGKGENQEVLTYMCSGTILTRIWKTFASLYARVRTISVIMIISL